MMKSYAHPSFTREQWVASASSSVEESPIVNKLARRPVFAEEEVATQIIVRHDKRSSRLGASACIIVRYVESSVWKC